MPPSAHRTSLPTPEMLLASEEKGEPWLELTGTSTQLNVFAQRPSELLSPFHRLENQGPEQLHNHEPHSLPQCQHVWEDLQTQVTLRTFPQHLIFSWFLDFSLYFKFSHTLANCIIAELCSCGELAQ